MNVIITSKEAILQASRNLLIEKGWSSINIRNVAKACNISIGTFYNYFDNKSDLLSATVESIWCDIFHMPTNRTEFNNFIDCINWAYESIRLGNQKYPGFFSTHSLSFVGENRTNGEALMEKSWKHIQDGFYTVLMKDTNIKENAFDEIFTPKKFVEIIFSLIISSILRQDYDCSAIISMAKRLLYK